MTNDIRSVLEWGKVIHRDVHRLHEMCNIQKLIIILPLVLSKIRASSSVDRGICKALNEVNKKHQPKNGFDPKGVSHKLPLCNGLGDCSLAFDDVAKHEGLD